jgi:adenylate cyclase
MLHAAGRFIGQAQIDFFLNQAGQRGFLGEKQQMAVLFSDIRGFTSLSETLAPDDLVRLLNSFLTRMTRCIEAEGGMVDKFIGDAVMAIFPETEETNAGISAARAALMMVAELEHMNLELAEQGHHLDIGIGLHWGRLVSGLIGSPQKRSYTVIGDTVNTCSRLEGMTKTLGAHILVSEALAARLAPDAFLLRPLGRFSPKGRQEAVPVLELMGLADGSAQAFRWAQDCKTSQKALEKLYRGQVDEALAQWRQLASQEADSQRAKGYHSIADMVQVHAQQPKATFLEGIPLQEK